MNITNRTKIELWGVLAAIPFLVGGIVWLTTIYSTAVEAQRVNEKQDLVLDKQMNLLIEIKETVIEIKANQKRR